MSSSSSQAFSPAFSLIATTRTELGKRTRALRRSRRIPAVLYGHGVPNQSLTVEGGAFDRLYAKAKESSLVDLTIDGGASVKVLIHDAQAEPLKGTWMHVDFHQVSMKEKVETEIELDFTGESPAVKEQGGILVKSLDKVKISCLPGDLVQSLNVDLSRLKTFEDALRVSDIQVPAAITILAEAQEVIATVTPPRSEAELASLEEKVEVDASTVEVLGKDKDKETETEAAAEGGAGADKAKTSSE